MKGRESLSQIQDEQPEVFAELERVRRGLWAAPYKGFNMGTLLVMTHKAAALWATSQLTPAWHHASFDPDAGPEEHMRLANDFSLGRIVFDDPEVDDFVELLPRADFDFIGEQQAAHPNWRNRPGASGSIFTGQFRIGLEATLNVSTG